MSKTFWSLKVAVIIILSFTASTLWASHLKVSVVTEEAFSLQHKSKITGKMEGPAAVLVEKVLNTADVEFSTKVLPWARAYKEAQQVKNTLIYSIVRTPNRENKFYWLGEISRPQYYLYALKSSGFLKAPNSDAFTEYKIGTILNSASYQSLKTNGFTNVLSIRQVTKVFNMLTKNKVDFITVDKQKFQSICASYSLKCADIVPISPIKMPQSSSLYFALSKNSDPALVSSITEAYNKLLLSGDISVF
jgi:polar amino acid transport system substrate-binding protein